MPNSFLDEFTFDNAEFHEFYKEHRKKVYYRLNRKRQVMASVNGILLTLKNMMVEYRGGVYLEGFGYFFFLRNTHKTKPTRAKTLLGKFKKYYNFFPYFLPDSNFKGWTFSEMFELHNHDRNYRDDYTMNLDICQSVKDNAKYMRKQVRQKR